MKHGSRKVNRVGILVLQIYIMKEFQMKAMAQAFANESKGTKSYVQKLSGKRLEEPVVKLFEDETGRQEAARVIVVIYTGDYIIIIIIES